MGLKGSCKLLAEAIEAAKLTRKFAANSTRRDNVIKTRDLRGDLYKDFQNPGWVTLKVQVNKDARDPGAKDFLKKRNTGSHKTTLKFITSIRFSQDNFNHDGVVAAVRNAYNAIGMESTVESLELADSVGGGKAKNGKHMIVEPTIIAEQQVGEWVYDHEQKMNKYWDGFKWVFYDQTEKKEKYWDGNSWQRNV